MVRRSAARRAAGGLDGDRLAVVRTPSGDAVVWASVWDTSIDAADFLDAVMDAMRKRYDLGKGAVVPGATTRRLDVPAAKGHGADILHRGFDFFVPGQHTKIQFLRL